MKAQGLSISFVVTAALAILVLVLAVAFVMGWFGSSQKTVSMQKAKSICNGYCNSITTAMSNIDCTTGISDHEKCVCDNATNAYKNYCGTPFKISGHTYTCNQIAPCTVQDAVGNSISITCSYNASSNPKCAQV